MKRDVVFKKISDERDYQEMMKNKVDSHVVEDFNLGDGLSAIRYNLSHAEELWYSSLSPHEEAMNHIRKIAAICVQMGEKYNMPSR